MGRPADRRARTSPGGWIPWIFVAGFLVTIAVNATLVWLAVATFSGLETEHPYERGLDYNRVLAAAQAQQVHGWQVSLKVVPSAAGASEARRVSVVASFLDRDGRAIDGLAAAAAFLRPVRAADDVGIELVGEGGGRYEAELDLPLGGFWDVELTATGERGQWHSRQRFRLP